MNAGTRSFTWTGRVALLLMLSQTVPVVAQTTDETGERRLAPGDEIAITVPGRPELDTDATLDAVGRIEIEQVGEVQLTGLTTEEAVQVLRQRVRLFYPEIDNLVVELRSASHVTIYAIGGLRSPGDYEFAAAPTVWDLVRAAGGPTDNADLRMARVVRQELGTTTVFSLDLSGMLSGGDVPAFALRPGDTLVVPTIGGDVTATVPGVQGVQVFGGVSTPAVVAIDEPTLMLDILMRAGAPTPDADLKSVWWVHRSGGGYISSNVDVRRFLEEGDPAGNPLVHPGDTLEVQISSPGWIQRNLPLILGVIATTATVALAWNTITRDNP